MSSSSNNRKRRALPSFFGDLDKDISKETPMRRKIDAVNTIAAVGCCRALWPSGAPRPGYLVRPLIRYQRPAVIRELSRRQRLS